MLMEATEGDDIICGRGVQETPPRAFIVAAEGASLGISLFTRAPPRVRPRLKGDALRTRPHCGSSSRPPAGRATRVHILQTTAGAVRRAEFCAV